MNIVKTLRNNWKKSVFGISGLIYGTFYTIESYKVSEFMKQSCMEASMWGEESIKNNMKPQNITIILNPASKKRKSKKFFEKYCEPLFHLAGYAVTIIQTQSENHARSLVENITNADINALVVAGGDGTLSDVVTGFMRNSKSDLLVDQCPIGILPLGKTNMFAEYLFNNLNEQTEIKRLIESTMAVIKGKTKKVDVIEVEVLQENKSVSQKLIYAFSNVQFGVWTDAFFKADKYWYWSSLKKYVTYIFMDLKNYTGISNSTGVVRYTNPCDGCSKCYNDNNSTQDLSKRWWHFSSFVKNPSNLNNYNAKDIINEKCGIKHELTYSTIEMCISTINNKHDSFQKTSKLIVEMGPKNINYFDYVAEGWRRVKGCKTLMQKVLEAKDVELHPSLPDNSDKEYSIFIDGEKFELKPIKLRLLREKIKVFCL